MADINLTTTAVTPTGINIGTLRWRLRSELHDEDATNYRWTDAVLDRAARELSLVLPREQKTALITTAGSREVGVAGLSDRVRIEAVEYPAAKWPPSYVQFSLFESTLTLLSVSTLPAVAEDVVVTGAAAYAALEWASFASNRANVSGTAAFESYQTWGEERLKLFHEAMRRFGREARVRNTALYRSEQAASRSTVQWPG